MYGLIGMASIVSNTAVPSKESTPNILSIHIAAIYLLYLEKVKSKLCIFKIIIISELPRTYFKQISAISFTYMVIKSDLPLANPAQ